MSVNVLVTGGAGRVATALRPMLRDRFTVRLTDLAEPGIPAAPGESFVTGDLRDRRFARSVTEDVSAIIHLAGEPDAGAPWSRLIDSNIALTATLLEEAGHRQIRRVVLASSIHAIGGYNDPRQWPVPPTAPAYPCCRYGVSKVAIENLGHVYSDEVPGSTVVCLRLPLVTYPIRWGPEARAWLDESDLRTLVAAALRTRHRFGAYVGASDCPRPRFDISAAHEELGWAPTVRVSDQGLPTKRPPYADGCRLWPQSCATTDQ